MRIYTRGGDTGETGLFGGGRVPKDDARVEARFEDGVLKLAIAKQPEAKPRNVAIQG